MGPATPIIVVIGVIVLIVVVAMFFDGRTEKGETRRRDVDRANDRASRAEATLDAIEVALESYPGLDIVGATLAQDVRTKIRAYRTEIRKIEEKRKK